MSSAVGWTPSSHNFLPTNQTEPDIRRRANGLEEAIGQVSTGDAERIFGLNAVSAHRLRGR
jgi:hypothetical protein